MCYESAVTERCKLKRNPDSRFHSFLSVLSFDKETGAIFWVAHKFKTLHKKNSGLFKHFVHWVIYGWLL